MILILLFSNLSGALYAEETVEEDTTEQTVGEETTDEEEGIMPCDIIYNQEIFAVLNRNVTVYCAPYEWGNASSGYTLSAGQGVFVIGREYECFYVYWYIGDREMYGYIPLSSVSVSNYYWIEYDIFRPGTCTATTPVLSYAGTTNTYFNIGEIYAGESPLMVLGQIRNQFNNRLYYFVQYQTAAGLAKRGWVDASSGTVTYHHSVSETVLDCPENQFCFLNRATGMALTWNPNTNNVEQRTMSDSLYQLFTLEKVMYGNKYTGYYRIVSVADPSKTLAVTSTGYAEGLSIVMQPKGDLDKRQEFLITSYISDIVYSFLFTRSSGQYRVVEVYGGSSAEGTDIIHSKMVYNANQTWQILRVSTPWSGTYGQYSGSASPANYKVHYDSSISSRLSLSDVQECVSRWNNAYNKLSLQAINKGSQLTYNRLATVVNGSLDGTTVGYCCVEQRNSSGLIFYDSEASKNHVNENWNSTVIQLDISKMEGYGYTSNDYKTVLTHELGHSLKLSHTFMIMDKSLTSTGWMEYDYPIGLMNPISKGSGYPINIDIFRLKTKWDSIM